MIFSFNPYPFSATLLPDPLPASKTPQPDPLLPLCPDCRCAPAAAATHLHKPGGKPAHSRYGYNRPLTGTALCRDIARYPVQLCKYLSLSLTQPDFLHSMVGLICFFFQVMWLMDPCCALCCSRPSTKGALTPRSPAMSATCQPSPTPDSSLNQAIFAWTYTHWF